MSNAIRKTYGDTVRINKRTGVAARTGGGLAVDDPLSRRVAQFTPRQLAILARIRELHRFASAPVRNKCFDEQPFLYPKFGRAVVQMWNEYMTGCHGMTAEQKSKWVWAAMEQICDDSREIPGLPHWWVK